MYAACGHAGTSSEARSDVLQRNSGTACCAWWTALRTSLNSNLLSGRLAQSASALAGPCSSMSINVLDSLDKLYDDS